MNLLVKRHEYFVMLILKGGRETGISAQVRFGYFDYLIPQFQLARRIVYKKNSAVCTGQENIIISFLGKL